jgi:cell division protein FtsQ
VIATNETEARNEPIKRRHSIPAAIWFFLPLAAMTIVFFVLTMQWKETLLVESFEISGTHILSPSELIGLAGIQPDEPMYRCDLFEMQKRICANPYVSEARINRQFMNLLQIEIVERTPFASMSGSELRYLDSQGVVLPVRMTGAKFDLPLINGVKNIDSVKLGETVQDENVSLGIQILQAGQAAGFYRTISEVNMNNGGDVILYSAERGIPIMFGRDDIVKKMFMLQAFWTDFMNADSSSRAQYVDARFDGQIVVKWGPRTPQPQPKVQM